MTSDDVEFRFYRPHPFVIDASMIIIWLLAVLSVLIGGYWSGQRKIAL
jgi:hypothetical protein